jgi:hypothetical protein
MSTVAFAATASNTLGTAPGITISDYDPDGDVHVDLSGINSDPGEDEDGDLDVDNADAILASAGWSRIGQWTPSSSLWAAEIERKQEENPR